MKNNSILINLKWVVVVLLAIIAGMLFAWKPWASGAQRTIDITGQASVKGEPDSYIFSPTYQKKGTDRATIQNELQTQISGVVTQLKELGVAEKDITLQSSTYDNYYNDGTSEVSSNSLTVTVENKDIVQKVQDYLVTTNPYGQTTPYPSFTEAKRKELESQARTEAIKDAKVKAEKTANELGLKIGRVVAINDSGFGGGYPQPYATTKGGVSFESVDGGGNASLPVLSGQQEVSSSVQVTYEMK